MDISVDDIIKTLKNLCECKCTNTFACNTLFFNVSEKDYEDDNFRVRDRKYEEIILSSKLKKAEDIHAFLEKEFADENRICYADVQLYAVNGCVNIVKVCMYEDYSMWGKNHDVFCFVRPPSSDKNKKFDLNFFHSKFFMFRLWLLSLKLKWTGVID